MLLGSAIFLALKGLHLVGASVAGVPAKAPEPVPGHPVDTRTAMEQRAEGHAAGAFDLSKLRFYFLLVDSLFVNIAAAMGVVHEIQHSNGSVTPVEIKTLAANVNDVLNKTAASGIAPGFAAPASDVAAVLADHSEAIADLTTAIGEIKSALGGAKPAATLPLPSVDPTAKSGHA